MFLSIVAIACISCPGGDGTNVFFGIVHSLEAALFLKS